MLVQEFGRIGHRRWLDWCRLDWREFLGRWFGYRLFGCVAMPFDFFEGDQVDFTQEFDDLGLGWVHARIMAVVVAGVPVSPPGWWLN
jgi:hypothetical protein